MFAKRIPVIVVLVVLATVVFGGAVLAINMYQEKVAGLGKWEFTDEVEIDEIEPEPADDQVIVKLLPTANTVADYVYTVTLELDDVAADTDTVTWSAAEIAAATKKTVIFGGLALAPVTVIEVKATE